VEARLTACANPNKVTEKHRIMKHGREPGQIRVGQCTSLYTCGTCTCVDEAFGREPPQCVQWYPYTGMEASNMLLNFKEVLLRPTGSRRKRHSQDDSNSRTNPHRTEFGMDDNYDFEGAGEYLTH